jgi:hypothetical protein
MPVIVSCPQCEKKLRVPDNLLGKKVRCPGCSGMFIGRAAEAPPPEEEEAPPPPPPPKAAKPPARPQPPPEEDEPEEEEEGPRGKGSKAGVMRRDDVDDNPKPRRSVVPPPVKDGYEDEESHKRRRSRRDEEEDYEDDYADARRRRAEDYEDDYEEDEDHPRSRYEDYDDDYEEEDRMSSRERKGWRSVRTALLMVVIAGWLSISTYGVMIVGVILLIAMGVALFPGMAAGGPGAVGGAIGLASGVIVFVIVLAAMGLAETVLRLVGYGMCMSVPPKRGTSTKGLAIGAFSCAAGGAAVNLLSSVLSGFTNAGAMGAASAAVGMGSGVFGILSGILALVGFFLFLFALRGMAFQLRDKALARSLMSNIIAWFVYIGVSFTLVPLAFCLGMAAIFGVASQSGTPASAATGIGVGMIFMVVLGALVFLVGIGLYVWYILLVQRLRRLVTDSLR